ncbi:hypothetical protein E2C01_008496 [Portunus trituberculatus]|uniref:Uncharacterized protein n=1 Tax=Portunus trituberculatus TaxID=210409 RepID=A0A5B7D2J3_PORTR|nr:hypothetical protein [Portunus trituberculatus]
MRPFTRGDRFPRFREYLRLIGWMSEAMVLSFSSGEMQSLIMVLAEEMSFLISASSSSNVLMDILRFPRCDW